MQGSSQIYSYDEIKRPSEINLAITLSCARFKALLKTSAREGWGEGISIYNSQI